MEVIASTNPSQNFQTTIQSQILPSIRDWLLPPAYAADAPAPKPPTNEEIKLLRDALGAIYGERNPTKAEELLSKAIVAWERQPPDEKAALYRVRGDCYMVRRTVQKTNFY